MFKKNFCPYCGENLSDLCDCERLIEEAELERMEDYANQVDVQYGWAQQDLIDSYRFEK